MRTGIKLLTAASLISIPALSYGLYTTLTGEVTDEAKTDLPEEPKQEEKPTTVIQPVSESTPKQPEAKTPSEPQPQTELQKNPAPVSSSTSQNPVKSQEEIQRLGQAGNEEFTKYLKGQTTKPDVQKLKDYFKYRGGPENPGSEFKNVVYGTGSYPGLGDCYLFYYSCPKGYLEMVNTHTYRRVGFHYPPDGFK